MMRLTRIIFFLIIASGLPLHAQTDYSRIEGKAARFFEYGEWSSANAMYLLMLEQQPRVTSTYAHAVVADIMAGDTLQALEMIPRSMSYEVPLDTLLGEVKSISFSIGRGDLYENYLQGIKKTYPWFSRVADNYLMQYYAFRQNGIELIKYAKTMLSGLPDNRNFLRMLAHGYMLSGDTGEALRTWGKTVELYPDDYDTILDLANCNDTLGDKEKALKWFRMADSLRATPYVSGRIAALSGQRVE